MKGHDSSDRWTFLDGGWHAGAVPLMTASTHAAWLGSVVFDGARHFDGMAPDMALHCQRAVDSARTLGLEPTVGVDAMLGLVADGAKRFAAGAQLYVRPMFWAENGFIAPDPDSTRFALVLSVSPLPQPTGFSACMVPFERPVPAAAPTKAKAACHYPNLGLAMRAAKARGYDAGVITDGIGNVAEFAMANLMFGKDGEVHTPVANGTFLAGITRRRV
ncbi:MAG: branched-chain amino acid aminotransferase, partial [Alphaproteobacteria bacterium]